jgi:hypothetical protein
LQSPNAKIGALQFLSPFRIENSIIIKLIIIIPIQAFLCGASLILMGIVKDTGLASGFDGTSQLRNRMHPILD